MRARTGTAPSWGAVRARRPGGRGGGDRWGPSEIARRTGGHDDGGPAATGYGRRPAGRSEERRVGEEWTARRVVEREGTKTRVVAGGRVAKNDREMLNQ